MSTDRGTVDTHLASADRQRTGEKIHQGRLTSAVVPYQANTATSIYRERHIR